MDTAARHTGRRAFWWSVDDGFHDLGALVSGLAANGWQSLYEVRERRSTFAGGSPLYLAGLGLTPGHECDADPAAAVDNSNLSGARSSVAQRSSNGIDASAFVATFVA